MSFEKFKAGINAITFKFIIFFQQALSFIRYFQELCLLCQACVAAFVSI